MSLGEEDLGVLMKILVENIGEGNKEHSMDVKRQVAQGKFTLTAHDGKWNKLEKSHFKPLNSDTAEVIIFGLNQILTPVVLWGT